MGEHAPERAAIAFGRSAMARANRRVRCERITCLSLGVRHNLARSLLCEGDEMRVALKGDSQCSNANSKGFPVVIARIYSGLILGKGDACPVDGNIDTYLHAHCSRRLSSQRAAAMTRVAVMTTNLRTLEATPQRRTQVRGQTAEHLMVAGPTAEIWMAVGAWMAAPIRA